MSQPATTPSPAYVERSDYSIRAAVADDIEQLMDMGEDFFEYSPFSDLVGFDADSVREVMRAAIDSDRCVVLVAEVHGIVVGGIIGALSGLWFNQNVTFASGLACWLDPMHRNGSIGVRLLHAFEDWARDKEARLVVMSDFGNDVNPRVARLFEKLGMRQIERSHVKDLG